MKLDATVVVVAPDRELRRSIEFLLQAEGFQVVSLARLPLRGNEIWPRNGCAVVDENAILAEADGWTSLATMPQPVVLLTDRIRHIPDRYAGGAVTKPLLGRGLLDAVSNALEQVRHPTAT